MLVVSFPLTPSVLFEFPKERVQTLFNLQWDYNVLTSSS
jgi:hypothetical protein